MNVLIWSLSTSIGLLEHGLSFSENLDKIFQTTLKQQCFDKVSQKVSSKVSFDKVSFIILEIIKHNMPKCYSFLSSSIIKWLQWIQQCMHKTFWRSLSLSSFTSVHLSTVSDSFNTMDCSTPGFPVHHQLPKLTQIHVHQVSDAIQPSHPLSSPSPVFNLPQHQGLFKRGSSSHQVTKVLEFQLQHQSFQWIFRTDFL